MKAALLTRGDESAAEPFYGRGVWAALLLSETARVMRHPAVLGALALIIAREVITFITNPAAGRYPNLISLSWRSQYILLVLAGATFIATSLSALRQHRFNNQEFEHVLSLPAQQRALATSVAATGPAVAGFLLTIGQLAVAARAPGAAGAIRWGEVLAGPLTILFTGILGVAIAMLTRNAGAAFIALAMLAVVGFYGLVADESTARWLSFVAGQNPFTEAPVPNDLVARPQWWHVCWLVALVGLSIVLVLRTAGTRLRVLLTPGVALTVLAVVAAVGQFKPASDGHRSLLLTAQRTPAALQVCEERNGVSYCAFPDFQTRIDAWADIVEAQLSLLPEGKSAPSLHVRQHLENPADQFGTTLPLPVEAWAADDNRAGTPNAIPVSTRWAAGGADSYDEVEVIGFSALVADRLTGGVALGEAGPQICGARGAVVLWLAAAATAETRSSLKTLQAHTFGGSGITLTVLNSLVGVQVGARELALAQALLDSNPDTVRNSISAKWADLIDPKATVEDAAALLGLKAGSTPVGADQGICG